MKEYERTSDLVTIRTEVIDDLTDWTWPKTDNGAWEGPKSDWVNSHKDKYTKYCKKLDTVFCAGGNCGMYPRLFSHMFKWVYTFEPDWLNFYCLSANCDTPNVIKINGALGDENAMANVTRSSMENVGMHKITTTENIENNHVPVFRLNDFYPEFCDLLQLDAEGYEPRILDGGWEFINRYRPVIASETITEEMQKVLESIGYEKVDQSVSDAIFAPK